MKKNLICISCPLGCELEVEYDEAKIISVFNNKCKKGNAYAQKELFCPERIVTTTVKLCYDPIPLLPVKTEKQVPKHLTFEIVNKLSRMEVHPPVRVGDVILSNICKTGINIVATRSVIP